MALELDIYMPLVDLREKRSEKCASLSFLDSIPSREKHCIVWEVSKMRLLAQVYRCKMRV